MSACKICGKVYDTDYQLEVDENGDCICDDCYDEAGDKEFEKTNEQKHTPLDWYATCYHDNIIIQSASQNEDNFVAEITLEHDVDKHNANFIIKACNNYYELLSACKDARDFVSTGHLSNEEMFELLDMVINKCGVKE
jgi:hypothetical protein